MRLSSRITPNKLAATLGLGGLAVGLVWPALGAIGYELSRAQGYILLIVTIVLFLGMFVALLWPDSRSNEGLEVEQYRQRAKVIDHLQGLLVENERTFQSLAHPYIDDPENRGKEAQQSYGALDRYYRKNRTKLTELQLREKIEKYLNITREVLNDFLMLNEPNPTLRAWNLPSDQREQDEMRRSVARRVYADLPNLHEEIEEGFSEALRSS